MTDPRLEHLDAIARHPETHPVSIYDSMIAIGADVDGLRSIVDHFGDSKNPVIFGYLAMTIAKAAWNWGFGDARILDIVLSLVASVRRRSLAGPRVSAVSALDALRAGGILPLDQPHVRGSVAEFVIQCVDPKQDWTVPHACLGLLSHFQAERALGRLLDDSTATVLKSRLSQLDAEKRPELQRDLTFLRDFWGSD